MYATEITVNGKTIPIRFGAYVIKKLADDGIRLQGLPEHIKENRADIVPRSIYYGAINASEERRGDNVSLNDIYDWLDEIEGGLFGEEASKVIDLFTQQMSDSVPKNLKAGKAPQKKNG
jgi:hypothetical protein